MPHSFVTLAWLCLRDTLCLGKAVVEQHLKVKEAGVIGVGTKYGDQKIKEVLVPAEPVDELGIIESWRNLLADFKVRSVAEFLTQLPKNSTGEIPRKAM